MESNLLTRAQTFSLYHTYRAGVSIAFQLVNLSSRLIWLSLCLTVWRSSGGGVRVDLVMLVGKVKLALSIRRLH